MTERECKIDDYWTEDIAIDEGMFYKQPHAIRIALHQSQEHRRREEFLPAKSPTSAGVNNELVPSFPASATSEATSVMTPRVSVVSQPSAIAAGLPPTLTTASGWGVRTLVATNEEST